MTDMPLSRRMFSFLNVLSFVGFIIVSAQADRSDKGITSMLEGNVTIIGLFDVFEPITGQCSNTVHVDNVMIAEAVKWYLSHLNEDGNLPVNIGFEGWDVCSLESKLSERTVDIMGRVMNHARGETGEIIAGIIGPPYSWEAAFISPVLSSLTRELTIPQIGFSTTGISLSDGNKYPNFFRVIPGDQVQVDVMLQTLIQLGWNRMAIIYEDSIYGREGAMELQKQAELARICVPFTDVIALEPSAMDVDKVRDKLILGQVGSSAVSGYVFWGSYLTAKRLLASIERSGYKDTPIGLLSESSAFVRSVFESNGKPLPRAKGTLVVSPAYTEVTEFSTHWMSIFRNESKFEMESQTNHWLHDVLKSVFHCEKATCTFPLPELESKFGDQSVFIQYAIYAAHSVALAVKQLHERHCGPGNISCDNFYSNFRPGHVTEALKNISVNMMTDFNFTLSSLTDTAEFNIEDNREAIFPADRPRYYLLNYKEQRPGQFGFVEVGEYKRSNLTVDLGSLCDYLSDGTELLWPNTRRAICMPGNTCSECIQSDLSDEILFIEGDVYVVALVPVYDKSNAYGCSSIRFYNGYQIADAIRFAILNYSSGSTFSTGMKIGLIVLNSCNSPSVVQRKITQLYDDGVLLGNGTLVKVANKILGFVGDVGSEITISASNVLKNLNHILVSYASTSPALSDKKIHPYFMRVVGSALRQVLAMIEILKKHDSNYVQVIYSKGAYGEDAKNSLKERALPAGICIKNEIEVAESSNYFQYFNILRQYPHAKIVIVFLRSHVVLPFFKALLQPLSGEQFMFIGSTAWAINEYVIRDDNAGRLVGSMTVKQDFPQNIKLEEFIKSKKLYPFIEDPWVQHYLETKRGCYFQGSFNKSYPQPCGDQPPVESDPQFEIDEWVTTAFIAATSLLKAAEAFIVKQCGNSSKALCLEYRNPEGLMTEMKKVTYDGRRVFLGNGDGTLGYGIYKIMKNPLMTSELQYKKVGIITEEAGAVFDEDLFQKSSGMTSKCPNQLACDECLHKSEQKLDMPESSCPVSAVTWVLLVLLLLAIGVSVAFIVLYLRLRKQFHDADGKYLHVYSTAEPTRPDSETDPYITAICKQDTSPYQEAEAPVFQLESNFG